MRKKLKHSNNNFRGFKKCKIEINNTQTDILTIFILQCQGKIWYNIDHYENTSENLNKYSRYGPTVTVNTTAEDSNFNYSIDQVLH